MAFNSMALLYSSGQILSHLFPLHIIWKLKNSSTGVSLYVLANPIEMYTVMNLVEYLYNRNVVKSSSNSQASLNMEVPTKPLTLSNTAALNISAFNVVSQILGGYLLTNIILYASFFQSLFLKSSHPPSPEAKCYLQEKNPVKIVSI